MRLVKNHARPLFLCNPSLAVRAEAAGMDYLLLDRDPRWKSVLPKGKFREFELSFFYDDATQDRIMRLVKNHARPLFLCNPSLAVRAEAAGMDYLLLDRDPRWKSVLPKGKFRQFELSQPRQMRFQYDAVFVDPPFANVELADLRRTVDLLAANETQAKAPVYLAFISDREDAVMDAFRGYGLERKGAALGYHSVKQSTQERIFMYGPRADWTADDS